MGDSLQILSLFSFEYEIRAYRERVIRVGYELYLRVAQTLDISSGMGRFKDGKT